MSQATQQQFAAILCLHHQQRHSFCVYPQLVQRSTHIHLSINMAWCNNWTAIPASLLRLSEAAALYPPPVLYSLTQDTEITGFLYSQNVTSFNRSFVNTTLFRRINDSLPCPDAHQTHRCPTALCAHTIQLNPQHTRRLMYARHWSVAWTGSFVTDLTIGQ